ncbi:MAG: histidine kinase dimerization/phospho-acceptor domain-containing protein [Candidatus Kapaibacterium sp.]
MLSISSLDAGSRNEQSPGLLSRLGRHLAHELNNPISAITSSAFLIQDIISASGGSVAASDIQPFIDSISEECEKLKTVVDEFAKFITTESVLTNRIDLVELVRARTNDMVREGLPVSAQVPDGTVFVEGDAGSLGFVLRTLTDFAAGAGATRIAWQLIDGNPRELILRDNRTAPNSMEDVENTFSPLWAAQQHGVGLGLKLPLAAKIVELHRGVLDIPEQRKAETEIRILLPGEY